MSREFIQGALAFGIGFTAMLGIHPILVALGLIY